MIKPGYSLITDPACRLLKVSLSGLWDLDTLENYRADRRVAIQRMADAGVAEAEILLLVDRRDQTVQSQELTNALIDMVDEVETRTARTAVIVGGALLRLQALRTSRTERTRVFTDESEAMDWLMS